MKLTIHSHSEPFSRRSSTQAGTQSTFLWFVDRIMGVDELLAKASLGRFELSPTQSKPKQVKTRFPTLLGRRSLALIRLSHRSDPTLFPHHGQSERRASKSPAALDWTSRADGSSCYSTTTYLPLPPSFNFPSSVSTKHNTASPPSLCIVL